MRQPQQSHQGVHRRREDESRGHEAFDVAVVGNESVYEFPDGIGEQECRSDHSQLRSIQRSAVENGFLHDIETRAADIVETVSERRRRECLQCQKRFTTYETVESLPIVVIKRDSSRQQFDRNKILNGMLRACEKRPVPLAELEKATDEIEQAIQNSLDREISTEKIGELVMERLKPLDEVAYVRFASVYRQFKDIDSFMRELNKILEER